MKRIAPRTTWIGLRGSAIAGVLGLSLAAPVVGQTDGPDLWGGVGGFLGGAVAGSLVGAGVAVSRPVIFDQPYYGFEGLSWVTPFTVAGAAAGAVYGSGNPDDLGDAALGALVGLGAGFGGGMLLGLAVDEERKLGWGVIGAALGVVVGTALVVAGDDEDEPGAEGFFTRVPLLQLRVP